MLNKDTFATDPAQLHIANQGVAKARLPPARDDMATLRGELQTFVCDGAYGAGLTRIIEGFLGAKGDVPAAWISGFYGSGKSHLAKMLGALWTNLEFDDGARADGLIRDIPGPLRAALTELRTKGRRSGGMLAAGDTLGTGPDDPAAATLQIILRATGLPTDVRAAKVALWLDDLGILPDMRAALGETFERDITSFVLSPRFTPALFNLKPDLATSAADLRKLLASQFPEPPPVTVDELETMAAQALLLGRTELPLTLIVLDEVQQFIKQDPAMTLKIQATAEHLSSRFKGKLLLVATGQEALGDLPDLQKLMGRFSIQVSLSAADIDQVIRRTILLKKPEAVPALRAMLDANAGEISRQLSGSKLAHSVADSDASVLDWPILPARRRLWVEIMRALDPTRLGSTLRSRLASTLEAARAYGDKPLGYAVPADFLYDQVASEIANAGLLPAETKEKIDALEGGTSDERLQGRVLSLVYMLSQIAAEADRHGVRATAEAIADL
ncbi:MAG TPA: hypothetical protein VGI30_00290, partial [Caulobacteraceae bacterium]